jgi:uncharacterized protein (TIGR02569 family)
VRTRTGSPPPSAVLAAFGQEGATARPLPGGAGRTWTTGRLVLKPVDDEVEATWTADVLASLVEDGFRINRPVPSTAGNWVVEGWAAWHVLAGVHDTMGRWAEVLQVARSLNHALSGLSRPTFLDTRTTPWAVADRMAWDEEPIGLVHDALRPLAERLSAHLRAEGGPAQVIHGDLTANVLFAPGLAPGVIDFSPYWRPAAFCQAVVTVDALLWHGAPPSLLDVPGARNPTSLLARAALFRLVAADRLAAERAGPDLDGYLRATVADSERVIGVLEARRSA